MFPECHLIDVDVWVLQQGGNNVRGTIVARVEQRRLPVPLAGQVHANLIQ
jgi:hypothetical protein